MQSILSRGTRTRYNRSLYTVYDIIINNNRVRNVIIFVENIVSIMKNLSPPVVDKTCSTWFSTSNKCRVEVGK